MTTEKKHSCCCAKHGLKKPSCQPFTIELLVCPECGLMFNKTFRKCPQCNPAANKKPGTGKNKTSTEE